MTDSELIDRLGGPAKVADLMGIPREGGVQRVHNWRTRGIPAAVRLAFPHLFPAPVAPAGRPCIDVAAPASGDVSAAQEAHDV